MTGQGFRGGGAPANNAPVRILGFSCTGLINKFSGNPEVSARRIFATVNKNRVKYSAFTMAEVLITIGIIGVVAAMTLPSLINKTQHKELQTAFLKTYSELNQASQLFFAREGESLSEYAFNIYLSTGSKNSMDVWEKFMKYFKGSYAYDKDNYHGSGSTSEYKIKSVDGTTEYTSICDVSYAYTDVSGKIYTFNDFPAVDNINGPVICVDINGKKGPNRSGYDWFLFVFTVNGQVIPMGLSHPNNSTVFGGSEAYQDSPLTENGFVSGEDYCKYSSERASGYACASYALSNTNPSGKGDYWNDFLR